VNGSYFASAASVIASARAVWRPPPRLSLSEWADRFFYLSAESSAQAGRWTTLPYQRGIMDAITDPTVTQVSVMKSARVGYTKCMNAAVAFHMHQNPCSMLVVQPTVDDAKGYSKEEIAPMLRDCPELAKIIFEDSEEIGPKDSGNTILHKRFPGGVLSMVGANSGAGFRRISRRVVIFDEVDGYPPSAGSDGDPVKLGIKRTEFFHDRKILAGSTPLIAGHSRIEQLFEAGDQRRYYVPCPQCGHMDHLVFTERDSGGHFMKFDTEAPEGAHFVCSANGCVIEHHHKRDMVARGEWRGSKPFEGHASFHIWAAYSYSPNATWAQIAAEFLEAKRGGREQLKTFINTVLGETWKEAGEAPDWERLYARREEYAIGSVPAGALFLTAGVDVQKDRWVYEVTAWGPNKESWLVEPGVIPGDTSDETQWTKLDELVGRTYPNPKGERLVIICLAIDSGFNTQMVYNWARRHERGRVIATKGVSTQRTLLGSPTPVDIKRNGQRIARGYKVWPVGVDIAKAELYGWLRLPAEPGTAIPPGFCHFPQVGADYFKQLTAEHLVTSTDKRRGYLKTEWQLIPGRENHYLDTRVMARVAAHLQGIDRIVTSRVLQSAPVVAAEEFASASPPVAPVTRPPAPPPRPKQKQIPRFQLRKDSGRRWLSKRR